MKLASYVVDGKQAFGTVVGEGVITLNERLGGTLRSRVVDELVS
jgi:hypothetical protein